MTTLRAVVPTVLLATAPLLAQWGPLTTSTTPSARSDALLAFDLVGNRMLMFGGNATNEFWSLVGDAWTQLTPAVLPGARARASLATDLLGGTTLLYGGNGSGSLTALDETWAWNGTSWQLLAPATTPGGRADHGMAFDNSRQTTVLFGGRAGVANNFPLLAQTWEFTQGTWSQALTAQSPPALRAPAMAWHPTLNGVLLFGGQTSGSAGVLGPASDETWLFDGTTWTELALTGPRPSARSDADLVWIASRGVVMLFGGRDPITMVITNDTWEHDGTSWRQITNVHGGIYPPRAGAAIAFDVVRDRVVAFGGVVANNALRDDTWEYGAQFQRFGLGCAGSNGVPTLDGGALPRLGATVTATIGNVPPAIPFAFMAVGLSRTQWALGALPALLTGLGMPGCRTYTSLDLLVYTPAAGGSAAWSFPIPQQPLLVGEAFHLQGVTFDPGANAFGLATSNAATLVVGW